MAVPHAHRTTSKQQFQTILAQNVVTKEFPRLGPQANQTANAVRLDGVNWMTVRYASNVLQERRVSWDDASTVREGRIRINLGKQPATCVHQSIASRANTDLQPTAGVPRQAAVHALQIHFHRSPTTNSYQIVCAIQDITGISTNASRARMVLTRMSRVTRKRACNAPRT